MRGDHMKKYISIIIVLLWASTYSHAQPTPSPYPLKNTPKLLFQEFQAFQNNTSLTRAITQQSVTEMELREALLKAEYEYDISVYQHRRKVFDWQHTSSIIIFWVVILIVVIGLFFSGMQFYISLKREKERIKKPAETSEHQESVTEFEASLQGIKVSSSVIGIIILVISLAFFYLYLVHVYPVSEVKQPVEQVEQIGAK
jgi:hypothetical protein